MTSSLLPLDVQLHRTHGWKRQTDYGFAADEAWAPVLLSEVPALLASYPLAFVAKPTGGYQLVAVQGLYAGRNLFVDAQGVWQVSYVPSCYRSYPFSLRHVQVSEARHLVLCFNQQSGLYREQPDSDLGELRFFDDEGQLEPLLQQLVAFLRTNLTHHQHTQRAVDALETAGLLEPWSLPMDNPETEQALQSGLHRINFKALDGMDGKLLALLRDTGALTIAYAQIFSIARLGVLRHLHKLSDIKPATEPPGTQPTSLDALLGKGRGEKLSFDWLK